jgi:hypothetical protein
MSVMLTYFAISLLLQSAEMPQTRHSAEKVAVQKAKELGFCIDSLDLHVSATLLSCDTLRFAYPYFKQYSRSEMKGLRKKIGTGKFWLVYFSPKELEQGVVHFGGDLWVFVDRGGKKVLMTIKGK